MNVSKRVYKFEGIILRRKNIGEADRIVTIFTKELGKIRVVAKGVRKISSRRGPHVEVFTHVQVLIYSGKILETLSDIVPIDAFPHIRKDLQKVSLAYYLCDLIDSLLPEKQEHADVFSLLTRALGEIEDLHVDVLYSKSKIFTLELLWALGFLPREKSLNGKALQDFIENITERKLKSTVFARHLIDTAGA